MKIAIIGTGPTGTNIGAALVGKDGVEVKYGSREPSAARVLALLKDQPGVSADPIESALDWADVAILATPSMPRDEQIQELAETICKFVSGKVVIDTTNPLTTAPAAEARWQHGTSSGELLAAALPEAYVYKAFNTIGQEHLSLGHGNQISGERLTMLFAGPLDKRAVAAEVIDAAGFIPKYAGPIRYARNLEAMSELWHHLAIPSFGEISAEVSKEWGNNFHFQVISSKK